MDPLTERELEVVKLVADGAANKQIAAALFISENTVKAHLKNIFVKLEADSRTKVATIAQRNGWVIAPLDPAQSAPLQASPDAGPHAGSAASPEARPGSMPVPAASPGAMMPRQPVPVAPNAEPLPALPRWRRVLSLAALAVIMAGAIFNMQLGRTRAQPTEGEFQTEGAAQGAALAETSTRWFARAPLDAARTRGAAFGLPGGVLLIGGTLNRAASAEVLIYNATSNTWRHGADKPTPLRLAAGALLSGTIYMPGGTDASGAATDRFEAYDPKGDTWRALPALPRRVSGHVVAAYNGRIYVFGGKTSDEVFNDAGFAYDVAGARWSTVPALPTVRSQAAAAVIAGRVYVIGGTDGQREYTTCEYLALDENRWHSCRAMTIARGGLGLAQIGSNLYAIGGGAAGNYIPFNEKYDARADRWQVFETPASRAGVWKNPAVASLPTEFM